MRYFRYKITSENFNQALKEHYKMLTADEKRIFKKEKAWTRCCSIAVCVLIAVFFAIGVYTYGLVPKPEEWFWKIISFIGNIVFYIALLIGSGIFAVILTKPLWKKADSYHLPAMKKEVFAKACAHLRKYYKLQEPYIITKCFHASDKKFANQDVCIFMAEDELRITKDLVHGFLNGEKDLGCYAFRRDEIGLFKKLEGKHLIAVLKAGDKEFLLGYRAKSFIEKNLIIRKEN